MARPRPVPEWKVRVVEVSTWRKVSKTSSSLACGMPMPVSATAITRSSAPSTSSDGSTVTVRPNRAGLA